VTERTPIQRSSRDPEQVRAALERWLAATLGPGSSPAVSDIGGSDANGMSSDTVLFTARWTDNGVPRDEPMVARIAPHLDDAPVFSSYDMQAQFDVIRSVAELTQVPVPRTWWCENSQDALGGPFFVMSRVDGQVPPDVLPYTFGGNWLFDGGPEAQRKLQTTTVEAIAALHDITDPVKRFGYLDRKAPGGTFLRRHVAYTRAWYQVGVEAGTRAPVIERALDWLEANWPQHESETVLSWGDSRIGNVIYDDFAPAALLDWEMAGLGPCELDVAWVVYAHIVFQSLATKMGLPGLPDFLRPTDVAEQYERLRGHAVRDLRFFMVYASVVWGIVFLRTGHRQIQFGERERPDDPQELIYNREHIDSLLADIDV
jgi:aminoglycoside phosphotransferase (APT) family kinase protein